MNRQTTEDYLVNLGRRARIYLPTASARDLVGEARDHLDASIHARLELGDSIELAEAGAIAAFGTPRALVEAAVIVHRARFQLLFLVGTTITGLGWAFSLLASPVLDRWIVVTTGLVFFAEFGALVECSKLRRPWKPLLAATVAFWLAFAALCNAWLRDFTFAGWLAPRSGGSHPLQAALWAAVAATAFFAYLALAYWMARPMTLHRGHRE